MSKILSLESSTDQCSVALYNAGEIISEFSDTPRAHAQEMLPMVERVMRSAGISLNELDAIAFDQGPGSFTGLRICLSLAQGLSFGAQKRLIAVSSLEALAAPCFADSTPELVISMLDARMGEIYWAAYQKQNNSSTGVLVEPKLAKIEDAKNEIIELIDNNTGPIHLVGPGCSLLGDAQALQTCVVNAESRPNAKWVAEIALNKWNLGQGCKPEDAELLYLRNSVSWNKRTKIRSEQK